MHLLLKPFFVLDRHADRFKPIEYVTSSIENDKAITRGWWVEPHSKYGMPGALDRDVTVVIYEIVAETFSKDIPVPKIMPIGSMREFLERMGLTATGPNMKAVKDSLRRLAHTLCTCEETFFDNKKKRYICVTFRLLQGFGFAGESDGNGGKHDENFVVFDEAILSNLNTGYVMVIDVDNVRKLKTDIAKQLYAHLSYRFYCTTTGGATQWAVDYPWLAVHLGITNLADLWRAKAQLKEAHEELKSAGYIAHYQWDGWRIIYRPGEVWKGEQLRRQSGKQRRSKTSPSVVRSQNEPVIEPHDPLVPVLSAFANGLSFAEVRLTELGITTDQAIRLCTEKNIPIKKT